MGRPTTYSKTLEEDRRAKISITKQLKKLTDIQEELENNSSELGAARVGALRLCADISLALLKKRLPDLKAVEHSGDDRTPRFVINAEPQPSVEEWQEKHGLLAGNGCSDDKPH